MKFSSICATLGLATALLTGCGGDQSAGDNTPEPTGRLPSPDAEANTQYLDGAPIYAWVKPDSTEIQASPELQGLTLTRSSNPDCNLDNYSLCALGQQNVVISNISDTAATLNRPATYWLQFGNETSQPLTVSTDEQPNRTGHSVIEFENQLWMIGGTERRLYNNSQIEYEYKNDVWRSNDGRAWTQVIQSAEFSPRTAATVTVFMNKLWLIGGQSTTGTKNDIWSSTDGKTWSLETDNAPFDIRGWHAVSVFQNKLWLIGGWNDTNRLNDIWSSTNGVDWELITPDAPFTPREGHSLTSFNEQLWLIGGVDNGQEQPADIWSSTNGVDWTQVYAQAPFGKRAYHTVTVYNDKLWLVAGQQNIFNATNPPEAPYDIYSLNDVWSSDNGVTWNLKSGLTETFMHRHEHQTVSFNNRLWVIAGNRNDETLKDTISTNDGKSWRLETTNPGFKPHRLAQQINFNNKLWLFGGNNDYSSSSPTWFTEDGLIWTGLSGYNFPDVSDQQIVEFNGKLWLIGGYYNEDDIFTHDIYSSQDGKFWQLETNNPPFSPRGGHKVVEFNNELWMYGGISYEYSDINAKEVIGFKAHGDMWHSSDGVTWSQVNTTLPALYDYELKVFKDKIWLIGGANSSFEATRSIWSSNDGLTWSLENAEATFPPITGHRVAILNDTLWLIGGSGQSLDGNDYFIYNTIWKSNDAINWQLANSAASFGQREFHQVTPFNGYLYLTGGAAAEHPMYNDTWRSKDGINWEKSFHSNFQTQ